MLYVSRRTYVITADACDIGSRKVSKIASVIAVSSGSAPIPRSNVQRAMEKSGQDKVTDVTAATEGCSALFCEGRDDLTHCDKPGTPIKMHNVSIDMHPGNYFTGHFSCSGRHTVQALVDHLMAFVEERGINLTNVRVVGGDGANTAVGYNDGWTALLEARLGRPFSRMVCLCHHAELPYRALFRALDDTFEGPIGQKLSGPVHELPLVAFRPLTSAELRRCLLR